MESLPMLSVQGRYVPSYSNAQTRLMIGAPLQFRVTKKV